jgi:hypothetical protein
MCLDKHAVVAASADAMFPPSGPIPVSGTDAGVVAYFFAHVAALPFGKRVLFTLLLLFLQLSPFVFGPRRTRFTRLTPEERARHLREMDRSPLFLRRAASQSLKFVLTLGYFACSRVDAIVTQGGKETSS